MSLFLIYGLGSEAFDGVTKTKIQKINVGLGWKKQWDQRRWRYALTPSLGAMRLGIEKISTIDGTLFANIDEWTFGPALRLDLLYRMGSRWDIGASYTMQSNWFSKNIESTLSFAMVSLRRSF